MVHRRHILQRTMNKYGAKKNKYIRTYVKCKGEVYRSYDCVFLHYNKW